MPEEYEKDNQIYNLFMYETSSKEEFTVKVEDIYGLPSNSTLAKDIYNGLHQIAMGLE